MTIAKKLRIWDVYALCFVYRSIKNYNNMDFQSLTPDYKQFATFIAKYFDYDAFMAIINQRFDNDAYWLLYCLNRAHCNKMAIECLIDSHIMIDEVIAPAFAAMFAHSTFNAETIHEIRKAYVHQCVSNTCDTNDPDYNFGFGPHGILQRHELSSLVGFICDNLPALLDPATPMRIDIGSFLHTLIEYGRMNGVPVYSNVDELLQILKTIGIHIEADRVDPVLTVLITKWKRDSLVHFTSSWRNKNMTCVDRIIESPDTYTTQHLEQSCVQSLAAYLLHVCDSQPGALVTAALMDYIEWCMNKDIMCNGNEAWIRRTIDTYNWAYVDELGARGSVLFCGREVVVHYIDRRITSSSVCSSP